MARSKNKRPVGAPRTFSTPDALKKCVNNYFASISRIVPVTERVVVEYNEDGKAIYEDRPVLNMLGRQAEKIEYIEKPSIQALCVFLGICKDTWAEYSKRENYDKVCAAAKLEMERDRVARLGSGKGDHGIEFDLKYNFGWTESITIDAGEKMQKAIETKPASMDEQLELLRKLGLKLPGEEP